MESPTGICPKFRTYALECRVATLKPQTPYLISLTSCHSAIHPCVCLFLSHVLVPVLSIRMKNASYTDYAKTQRAKECQIHSRTCRMFFSHLIIFSRVSRVETQRSPQTAFSFTHHVEPWRTSLRTDGSLGAATAAILHTGERSSRIVATPRPMDCIPSSA